MEWNLASESQLREVQNDAYMTGFAKRYLFYTFDHTGKQNAVTVEFF